MVGCAVEGAAAGCGACAAAQAARWQHAHPHEVTYSRSSSPLPKTRHFRAARSSKSSWPMSPITPSAALRRPSQTRSPLVTTESGGTPPSASSPSNGPNPMPRRRAIVSLLRRLELEMMQIFVPRSCACATACVAPSYATEPSNTSYKPAKWERLFKETAARPGPAKDTADWARNGEAATANTACSGDVIASEGTQC
eukprot:scaffold6193_cov123-Isochrysis_galbana.AAC.8